MTKLTLNVDGYTVLADILFTLRSLVREVLQEAHGRDWEAKGIPTPPREYLKQRRAREMSENWHARELDLLNYAGFLDLFAVISADSRLVAAFGQLHREEAVLRARFSELDTILNRIAYTRPLSDIDIDLLAGFQERLAGISVPSSDSLTEAYSPEAEPAPPFPEPAPAAPAGRKRKAPPNARKDSARVPEDKPAKAEPAAPEGTKKAPSTAKKDSVPARDAKPDKTEPSPPEATQPAAPPSKRDSTAAQEQGTTEPADLESALANDDDAAVLAALYQEVVSVAESLWNETTALTVPVWEQVRESGWYKRRFSPLGLRTMSDFYDVVDAAQRLLKEKGPSAELHEFLKERDLARILLALREVFKPFQSVIGSRGDEKPDH